MDQREGVHRWRAAAQAGVAQRAARPRGVRGLMAIGVKVMQRPERQVSYVRATLKGMGADVQAYVPEQGHRPVSRSRRAPTPDHAMGAWSISPRWRGTHRMLTDEQGRSKCVACGLCPQICPANCIKLVPGEDEQGNRYPLDLRDRRVPLRLLRLLPGSLPGRGDPRRRALREFGVQPGPLRVRPRTACRRRPTRSRRYGTRPIRRGNNG